MGYLIINKGKVVQKIADVEYGMAYESRITATEFDTVSTDEGFTLETGDDYDLAFKQKKEKKVKKGNKTTQSVDDVSINIVELKKNETFEFITRNSSYGPSGYCCFVTEGSVKFENKNMVPHFQSDKRAMPQDSYTHPGIYTITALEKATYKCVWLNGHDYKIEILQAGEESTFKDGKYCAVIYG